MFNKKLTAFTFAVLCLISCEKEKQEPEEIADVCEPNPCVDVDWSNGECEKTSDGYKCGCNENHTWNGTGCKGNTRTFSCSGLPENASWNSTEEITQKWTGSYWDPSETGVYSLVESSEYCRFKCSSGYGWEDGACVLKWEMVALGAGHTCGIRNGKLYCWGNAYLGKLGNGDVRDYRTKPVQVLFDREIVTKKDSLWKSVSAGTGHTCGILQNGELYCWGDNERSQIGDGTNENRPLPVRILAQEDHTFVKISTRDEHTCAINSLGDLYCWGINDVGCLGDGTDVDRRYPVKIGEEIGPWIDVSAGGAHTCAINSNGKLYCWGLNSRGQFGNNSHVFKSLSPVKVNEETDWKIIATGGIHTCAIKENGELYCWGGNDNGEVGDGNICPADFDFCADRYSPVHISDDHKWSYISIGYQNNAAKSEDGIFFVWGKNRNYALGNGNDIDQPFPVEMKNKWETVVMGGSWNYGLHTCAIDEQKDLYCWGINLSGQLGIGTTTDSAKPVKVEIPEQTEDKIDPDSPDNNSDKNDLDNNPDDEVNDSEPQPLCIPNPCTGKNKNVCQEVYDLVNGFEMIYKCFCNDGWIGKDCNKCQKGYYGKSCELCNCKKNEICNDGLDGDGSCICATEIVEEKCICYPGWSGENCEIFGENWSCTPAGESCTTSGDCCFDGICMKSFLNDETLCRKTLRYGDEEIRELAVSPDSSIVATARMGSVRLHRVDNLKELFRVSRSVQASTAIDISPDGVFLAVNDGGTLKLISMEDGTVIDSAYLSYNKKLKFSPDGKMLAAAHNTGFTVYDVTNDSLNDYFSDSLPGNSYGWNVDSVDFSPDSNFLIAGSGLSLYDQNAVIYDLVEKKVFQNLPINEDYVEVAFSQSGNMLATGGYHDGYENNVNVFKFVNNNWVFSYSLGGFSEEVHSLAFNHSEDFLAIGGRSFTGVYSLYDKFPLLLSGGWQVKFTPDDKNVIFGRETGELEKLSLPAFDKPFSSNDNGSRLTQLSADGLKAAFSKGADTVVFAESLTGNVLNEVILPFYIYSGKASFSSDLRAGAFSLDFNDDGGFVLFDFNKGSIVTEKKTGKYYNFAFSPNEKTVAVLSWYKTKEISFYSTETGILIHNIPLSDDETVSGFHFSPDGSIAGAVLKNKVQFFKTSDWSEIFSLPSGSVSFFPDGSKIILANGTVSVFSSLDGSEIEFPGLNINADIAVISADEKYLLTESGIIEIGTGRTVSFASHYYGITGVGISNNNLIVTTQGKDSLRVIDAKEMLEKYEGECSENSDCDQEYFCNKKMSRCFIGER